MYIDDKNSQSKKIEDLNKKLDNIINLLLNSSKIYWSFEYVKRIYHLTYQEEGPSHRSLNGAHLSIRQNEPTEVLGLLFKIIPLEPNYDFSGITVGIFMNGRYIDNLCYLPLNNYRRDELGYYICKFNDYPEYLRMMNFIRENGFDEDQNIALIFLFSVPFVGKFEIIAVQ